MKYIVPAIASLAQSVSSVVAAPAITVTPSDSQPFVTAPAEHFTGSAQVESRFAGTPPATIRGGVVSFEPAARTAWHSHPLGQTLIVTSGEGLVQEWGGPVQRIHPGDVVWIPAEVKHWHGATPTTGMSHIAFSETVDGKSVTWMEKVTDDQYPKP